MSKLFLETLDKNRKSIFDKLHNFKNIGILGGGTPLTLQMGHRISYDFDIFTHKKFLEQDVKLFKNKSFNQ